MASHSTQPTPLNLSTIDTQPATQTPAQPAKRKRVKHEKLTMEQLTDPSAVSSLVAVARATAAEYVEIKGSGKEARMLAALMRRASRWAASVAPKHSIAQFVIEARALSSKREVRALLSNMRAAQLRGADIVPEEEGEPGLIDESALAISGSGPHNSANSAAMNSALPPSSGAVLADVPDFTNVIDNDIWEEADAMMDMHPSAIIPQEVNKTSSMTAQNENKIRERDDNSTETEKKTESEAESVKGPVMGKSMQIGGSLKTSSELNHVSISMPLSSSVKLSGEEAEESEDSTMRRVKRAKVNTEGTTEGAVGQKSSHDQNINEDRAKRRRGRYISLDSDDDDEDDDGDGDEVKKYENESTNKESAEEVPVNRKASASAADGNEKRNHLDEAVKESRIEKIKAANYVSTKSDIDDDMCDAHSQLSIPKGSLEMKDDSGLETKNKEPLEEMGRATSAEVNKTATTTSTLNSETVGEEKKMDNAVDQTPRFNRYIDLDSD